MLCPPAPGNPTKPPEKLLFGETLMREQAKREQKRMENDNRLGIAVFNGQLGHRLSHRDLMVRGKQSWCKQDCAPSTRGKRLCSQCAATESGELVAVNNPQESIHRGEDEERKGFTVLTYTNIMSCPFLRGSITCWPAPLPDLKTKSQLRKPPAD